MPAKKHPDRDKFDTQLSALEALGIPEDYAAVVCHNRPDWTKRYVYDVRHGNRTDLECLGEIRRVAVERINAKLMHPTPVAA